MRIKTYTEFKEHLEEILFTDVAVKKQRIKIEGVGKEAAVIISVEDYNLFRTFEDDCCVNRLEGTKVNKESYSDDGYQRSRNFNNGMLTIIIVVAIIAYVILHI